MSYFLYIILSILCTVACDKAEKPLVTCRERSSSLRQDGGLCFEIPPWQHQPVALDQHISELKDRWVQSPSRKMVSKNKLALFNSEVSRYLATVLTPFLDTYHTNIQTSYQQFATKLLKRVKDEISFAVKTKNDIYRNLTELADDLKVPAMCDGERRAIRTLASRHVANIYGCTEKARASIANMGKYSDEMIKITKKHMAWTVENATDSIEACRNEQKNKQNVQLCIKTLSEGTVALGYELDLSLTNARRHNEQSCERLTLCCSRAKITSEESKKALSDSLYQCVYA